MSARPGTRRGRARTDTEVARSTAARHRARVSRRDVGWSLAVALGFAFGVLVGGATRRPPEEGQSERDSSAPVAARDAAAGGELDDDRPAASTSRLELDTHERPAALAREGRAGRDAGRLSRAGAEAACEERLRGAAERSAALERDLAAARADQTERDGEPIAMPPDLPGRFSGPAIRASLTEAFRQTRVAGQLEELDCSEYPCIAFGRLRGDEEDVERLERSRALLPYREDVLTLLFWAVSDDAAPREVSRETGIFALAFYARAERERLGSDRLDRRIRTRAIDLWATMHPGWVE